MRASRLAVAVLLMTSSAAFGGCSEPTGPVEVYHANLDDLSDIPRISEQGIELSDDSTDGGKSLYIENVGMSMALLRSLDLPELLRDDIVIVYSLKVRTFKVRGSVYPDLEIEFDGRDLYSAQITREEVLRGDNDWMTVIREFVLEPGQVPTKVNLNLVILGRGHVWVDDLRVLVRPRGPDEVSSLVPESLHHAQP